MRSMLNVAIFPSPSHPFVLFFLSLLTLVKGFLGLTCQWTWWTSSWRSVTSCECWTQSGTPSSASPSPTGSILDHKRLYKI